MLVHGRFYRYAIWIRDYLMAHPPQDPPWKLVNRVVVKGYVMLQKHELARLAEGALRQRILKVCTGHQVSELPKPLEELAIEVLGKLAVLKPERELPRIAGLHVDALPPCIKRIYEGALKGENLPHIARFTLATFMLNIGLSVDEVLDLFRRMPDFREDKARYQVEHVAGLRGSKIKYSPPSCRTLRTAGLCTPDGDLCGRVRHPLSYYYLRLRRGATPHAKGR